MPRADKDIILSVVIPTKNEEENIKKCIESVLRATSKIGETEIILVDSASTDHTIEIAKKYPIKIIQLDSSQSLSAPAGKYVGFTKTKGKYIQFLDGDMTMDINWFKNAIPVLEKYKNIAGVVGIPTQEPYDSYLARQFSRLFERFAKDVKEEDVKTFGGAILFKRDVLTECGSFNPYLVAEEESELAWRVVDRGYRFFTLPKPVTHHLGSEKGGIFSVLRVVIRYSTGQGQILRYSLEDKRARKYWVPKYTFFLLLLSWLIYGGISVCFIFLLKTSIPLWIWFGGLISIFIISSAKKRSLRRGCLHVLDQFLKFPWILRGFLKVPKDPNTYSTNVKVIKE